jgi:hypothetical protein
LSEDESFDGETIPGLTNEGTGYNPMAFAQSLMGGESKEAQGAGLTALMQAMKPQTGSTPAAIQEYEYMQKLSPEDQKAFMAVKRAPGAKVVNLGDKVRVLSGDGEILGEYAINPSPDKNPSLIAQGAQAKAAAQGKVDRWNSQMDEGLAAADGIPVITRSLGLLRQGVETGGWDNIKLSASNFFGVTGADEAELSANLGRAVLSQLRSTFGAAFTEREGDRLARIEAGFGKSTEANIRLLEELDTMARREAKRGIRAAKQAGDEDTAREIQEMLDYKMEPPAGKSPAPLENPTKEQFNNLPDGAPYIYDGVLYHKGR